jgi:hypothetical protein
MMPKAFSKKTEQVAEGEIARIEHNFPFSSRVPPQQSNTVICAHFSPSLSIGQLAFLVKLSSIN